MAGRGVPENWDERVGPAKDLICGGKCASFKTPARQLRRRDRAPVSMICDAPDPNSFLLVGCAELKLIAQSSFRRFPQRLPGQPIFDPVQTRDDAVWIASEWNTKEAASDFAGFVTAFRVDGDCLERFNVQVVGSDEHRELWVPAEELVTFNAHILGRIEVIDHFYGANFKGAIDKASQLPQAITELFAN